MSHSYQAIKSGTNYTLFKDGFQSFCPKLQPMPQEGAMAGQINWIRFPCNTGCPFATIEHFAGDAANTAAYNIACEGGNNGGLTFEVELVENEQPKRKPMSIIS